MENYYSGVAFRKQGLFFVCILSGSFLSFYEGEVCV
jgi:hypothetical protein